MEGSLQALQQAGKVDKGEVDKDKLMRLSQPNFGNQSWVKTS